MPYYRMEVPVEGESVWVFHDWGASRDDVYAKWLIECQQEEKLAECLGRFGPDDVVEVRSRDELVFGSFLYEDAAQEAARRWRVGGLVAVAVGLMTGFVAGLVLATVVLA